MHIVLALGIRGKHIYSTAEAPLKTIARTSQVIWIFSYIRRVNNYYEDCSRPANTAIATELMLLEHV